MITTNPKQFAEQFRRLSADRAVEPRAILQVVDPRFSPGAETADDNHYLDLVHPADPERALAQQNELTNVLHRIGLPVITLEASPDTPDAVFPNNVFATIPGRFIIGAMKHPARRQEANREDIRRLFAEDGYQTIDLSGQDLVAELTGPLIIDRARGVGYCGMTGRVDEAGCEAMHQAFDLALSLSFDLDPNEYHTNVVMSVLAGRACVIHPGSFSDPAIPKVIGEVYGAEQVLRLDDEEKLAFAGNCLAVTDRDVVISATAMPVLSAASQRFFETNGFQLHPVQVDELEKAGGSVRCMICEVF